MRGSVYLSEKQSQRPGAPRPAGGLAVAGRVLQRHGVIEGGGQQKLSVDGPGGITGLNWEGLEGANI